MSNSPIDWNGLAAHEVQMLADLMKDKTIEAILMEHGDTFSHFREEYYSELSDKYLEEYPELAYNEPAEIHQRYGITCRFLAPKENPCSHESEDEDAVIILELRPDELDFIRTHQHNIIFEMIQPHIIWDEPEEISALIDLINEAKGDKDPEERNRANEEYVLGLLRYVQSYGWKWVQFSDYEAPEPVPPAPPATWAREMQSREANQLVEAIRKNGPQWSPELFALTEILWTALVNEVNQKRNTLVAHEVQNPDFGYVAVDIDDGCIVAHYDDSSTRDGFPHCFDRRFDQSILWSNPSDNSKR